MQLRGHAVDPQEEAARLEKEAMAHEKRVKAHEKSMDEKLDAIIDKHEAEHVSPFQNEAADKEADVAPEQGIANPTPANDAPETVEPVAEEKPDFEIAEEAQANPDREKWIATLKRDSVPHEIIDGCDDTKLEAWAAKVAKRQKDVDKFSGEMSELKKKLKEKSEATALLEEVEEVDPDPEVEAEAEPDEIPGDENAKSVKELAEEVAELKRAQQAAVQPSQPSLQVQVDSAYETVKYAYGNRTPDKGKLIAEMNRLGRAKPNSYKTVLDLASEATVNLAGPKDPPSAPRRTAQPTPAKQISRTERPTQKEDVHDAALDHLMNGKTVAEVRQLLRK